jgi:cell division protein FtsQ
MDNRRWDFLLKDGITVKLPEEEMELALHKLAEAEDKDAVFEKDIIGIDLRDPQRFILQTRPGALEEYRAQAGMKLGDNI